jgi:steroid 5-alpha reductase family enzyme
MQELWLAYGLGGLAVVSMMFGLWLISLILRNSSIVDIFWGMGFVLANGLYFILAPQGDAARKLIITVLVTMWGMRLSLYILWRNWGKPEDYRYRAWRQDAGQRWWWQSFFQVFLLQGALLWIISAPLLAAQAIPSGRFGLLDGAGVGVWAIGFFFEAVGDWQLARFKSHPENKGKLLTSGVWRYTRHPNYFGDAAQWWGFYLLAASTGLGALTVFSPILMTFLLVRVSGVGMLEKALVDSKPGFREYMQQTNAFIPWFPRQGG